MNDHGTPQAESAELDGTLPLAAVYRRVSTDKQDGSLDTQEKRVDDYLRTWGFVSTPATAFYDADTSGSVPILERPGGAKLFSELGAHPDIKTLVVAKLDRLGRNAADLLNTVKALDKMGVTLHIVDLGGSSLVSNGPSGRLMLGILACMAEFERELIRSRIQDALDRRFGQKRIIGTEPYGYTLLPDGALGDNPVEQEVIHKMHRWRQAGCSYNNIAQQLNAEGVPTKTGKAKWQCGNVAGVLGSKHTGRILGKQGGEEARAA